MTRPQRANRTAFAALPKPANETCGPRQLFTYSLDDPAVGQPTSPLCAGTPFLGFAALRRRLLRKQSAIRLKHVAIAAARLKDQRVPEGHLNQHGGET